MGDNKKFYFKTDMFIPTMEVCFLITIKIFALYYCYEYSFILSVVLLIIGLFGIYYFIALRVKRVSFYERFLSLNYPTRLDNQVTKVFYSEIIVIHYVLIGSNSESMLVFYYDNKSKFYLRGSYRQFKPLLVFLDQKSINIFYKNEMTGKTIKFDVNINPDKKYFL